MSDESHLSYRDVLSQQDDPSLLLLNALINQQQQQQQQQYTDNNNDDDDEEELPINDDDDDATVHQDHTDDEDEEDLSQQRLIQELLARSLVQTTDGNVSIEQHLEHEHDHPHDQQADATNDEAAVAAPDEPDEQSEALVTQPTAGPSSAAASAPLDSAAVQPADLGAEQQQSKSNLASSSFASTSETTGHPRIAHGVAIEPASSPSSSRSDQKPPRKRRRQTVPKVKLPEGAVYTCANCGTTESPLFRRDEQGRTICNACGLYFRKNGHHRPPQVAAKGIGLTRVRRKRGIESNNAGHLPAKGSEPNSATGSQAHSPTSTAGSRARTSSPNKDEDQHGNDEDNDDAAVRAASEPKSYDALIDPLIMEQDEAVAMLDVNAFIRQQVGRDITASTAAATRQMTPSEEGDAREEEQHDATDGDDDLDAGSGPQKQEDEAPEFDGSHQDASEERSALEDVEQVDESDEVTKDFLAFSMAFDAG